MNTTMSLEERISAFAAAVRAELGDLPAEDADDITVGLAADLAERAADNDGVIDLDDPAGYAEELRTAAGLPRRADSASRIALRVRLADRVRNAVTRIRASRFGAWLLDLLIALRPVWWVLRGCVLYAIGITLMGYQSGGFWPGTPLGWLILATLILLSVQWGRDLWLPRNALRHVRTAASILGVVLLPFVLVWMVTPQVQYYSDEYYTPEGLLLDGVQVGNIFAYDADGNPLEDVQLFTGKGTPLNLYGARDEDFGWQDNREEVTVPLRDFRDQPIWNVYPLQEGTFDVNGELDESSIGPAPAPFGRATPVRIEEPSATPTPTPSPTETPAP